MWISVAVLIGFGCFDCFGICVLSGVLWVSLGCGFC